MNETTNGIQRRTFLAATAAAGTAAALTGNAVASVTRTPLSVGDTLAGGWKIGALESDHAGGLVVQLVAPDGGTLRALMTRHDVTGTAMASTSKVDVVLLNAGDGQKPTPDDHVAIVRSLAQRIDGNEAALPGSKSLLTATERQVRFQPIDH